MALSILSKPATWMLIILPLSFCGCSTIRTQDADGRTTTRVSFPVLITEITPTDAQIGNLQALGFVKTPLGTSVGYTQQQFVIDDKRCRVVVWANAQTNADALIEKLTQLEGVCVSANLK